MHKPNKHGWYQFILTSGSLNRLLILNILIAFSFEVLSLQLNVGAFPEEINSCIRLIFRCSGKGHFTCDHLFKTLVLRLI